MLEPLEYHSGLPVGKLFKTKGKLKVKSNQENMKML